MQDEKQKEIPGVGGFSPANERKIKLLAKKTGKSEDEIVSLLASYTLRTPQGNEETLGESEGFSKH
ncbi:hypothetical protein CAI21_21625 [Alkalilimnicola ehrlichii]|uniref:Uncharacterized protein n=1 Tax=Alkalilimnicola ehrlichii TaxID=351052 RepID=A0A3E0WSM9_9GAMM|nr:hypothetical protein [Alkalilimnicola ehrlichii]RFA24426.1 hypothetical protein CAI21_21625 [Alkalilimnicola ehrlichii]RFA35161.1 hypothetical protein CAL65_13740 [Alkalilimnicola ehrlichii]